MTYYHLLDIHIFLVISTYTLFFLRGIWSFNDSAMMQNRWIKTAPHVVDTFLLVIGLTLAFTLHQYPFVDAWLTAKMIGLLLYVGLGFIALNKGINKKIRVLAWLFAQMVFAYIVLVAITRNPLP
ncbi:MAG: SirB2 family protein [Gallionella sp.]